MGKKEYCSDCIHFYQSTISPGWGSSNRVVEIPGCSSCVSRHAKEVYKLNSDFEQKKQDYEIELSNRTRELTKSERDLVEQKKHYEKLISALKADKDSLLRKVEFLQVLRDSTQPDVVFEVPGVQLSAHCTILAARSAFFRKMVRSTGTAEKPPRVITVDDMSAPVLEAVVDFCYSGEFTFSECVPPEVVLKVAHTFELRCLKEISDVELCRRVTVDNVPQMLKLSRMFSAPRLQEEAGKVFKDNFDSLKSKIYEVLEAPDTTNSISDGGSGPCLDLEWNDI